MVKWTRMIAVSMVVYAEERERDRGMTVAGAMLSSNTARNSSSCTHHCFVFF